MRVRKIRGYVMKGLFEGELRFFFHPVEMESAVFYPLTFSCADFRLFVLMVVSKLGAGGQKKGFRGIELEYPDTESVRYPIYVDGVDVRAIHSLTSFEQKELEHVAACYNDTLMELGMCP